MKKQTIYLVLLTLWIFNPVYSQWQFLKGPGIYEFIRNVEVKGDTILINIADNIYLSTNNGENWLHLNGNTDYLFNISNISSIYPNVVLKDGKVFCVNTNQINSGIYSTEGFGKNWQFSSKGLPYSSKNTYIKKSKFYQTSEDLYLVYSPYLYEYNQDEKRWQIPYDTTSIEQKISIYSVLKDSNNIYFGTGYYKESLPETGCRTPNFFRLDLTTNKIISKLDSSSDICRYYILSLNKKDNLLLAGTTGGFYISTNEGENWIKTGNIIKYKDSVYEKDYIYQKIIVKDNFIYAIVTEQSQFGDFQDGYYATLICSKDNGENWFFPDYDKFFPGSYGVTLNVRDVEFYKEGILLGTSEGLYYMTLNMDKIEKINTKGLCGETVYDITSQKDTLYAVVGWNSVSTGLWRSTDLGDSWQIENNELLGKYMSSIAVQDSFIIVGSNYSGIPWISKDYGKSFMKVSSSTLEKNNNILTIKIIDSVVYIGTTKGIYCSKDYGESWYELSYKINKYSIYDIIKFNNILYFSTDDKILFTTDNGINWQESFIPKNINLTYSLNKMAYGNDKLFVTCGIYEVNGIYRTVVGGTVFVSSDYGVTWEEINIELPSYYPFKSIFIYRENKFIGGSSAGVYFDNNTNVSYVFWRPTNIGLTSQYLIKFIGFGKYLYAATGYGIYRLDLGDLGITSVDEIEKRNYLYSMQPYPQPATNRVQAEIYWDKALDINQAEIKVYNIYGEEINSKDKIEVISESDWYGKLIWNCEGTDPGVYIITINYGTEKKAIKVIKN